MRVKLISIPGFTLNAITQWARKNLAPGSTVLSDRLACFGAVTLADCAHQSTVVAGRKPKDVPELQWINRVMGNLKTGLSGRYHGFGFRKYAKQYLGAFAYRFNRRFDLRTLPQRMLVAALQLRPTPAAVDSDGG